MCLYLFALDENGNNLLKMQNTNRLHYILPNIIYLYCNLIFYERNAYNSFVNKLLKFLRSFKKYITVENRIHLHAFRMRFWLKFIRNDEFSLYIIFTKLALNQISPVSLLSGVSFISKVHYYWVKLMNTAGLLKTWTFHSLIGIFL